MSGVRSNGLDDAGFARANGWGVGTRLVGDEGYGPTVIEITALGTSRVLARCISHNGQPSLTSSELTWTFSCRDWAVTR